MNEYSRWKYKSPEKTRAGRFWDKLWYILGW